MSKIMPEELDAIDRAILEALQAEGRLTNVELARAVALSPSPCLRRVKRLEERGYIDGYSARLDRRRLGLGLTVFVDLRYEGHSDENAETFRSALRAMPEVVSCHIVSGEADFLLEVVVPDLEHFERFLMGKLLRLPRVRQVRSNFVIQTVKAPSPLPLTHVGG